MVFLCGLIVCFSGFDLVVECSELYSGTIHTYPNAPFFHATVPVKPSISRAALAGPSLSVAYILSAGGRAEIRLAIVETVPVNVIDDHAVRDLEHLAVHAEPIPFAFFG